MITMIDPCLLSTVSHFECFRVWLTSRVWSDCQTSLREPLTEPLPNIIFPHFRAWDDMVGNPHRAQTYKFELFELIHLSKLDKQFSIEQSEPTASQSTVASPLLTLHTARF